jgi:sigma-B regulation protein RsbU (phosphoserine phosphatase)
MARGVATKGAAAEAEAKPADVYRLRELEIWGGNGAASERFSVSGFDGWLYARPYRGDASGGDVRYCSTCAAGKIVRFTIADISGHGEEAAGFAERLRVLIRRNMNTPNPTTFARALNRELSGLSSGGRFATALITTYFAPTDHLIVCNAGHPRPLLYRASLGGWEVFDEGLNGLLSPGRSRETGIANLPLGVLHPANYPQFALRLEPGDAYVSYTDAFIEASDAAGRQLGEEGLLEIVRSVDVSDPGSIGPAILSAVDRHRGGRALEDDATLLVLRHNATDPPDGAIDRIKALGRLVGLFR